MSVQLHGSVEIAYHHFTLGLASAEDNVVTGTVDLQQDVACFEIPVRYPQRVEIVQPLKDIGEDMASVGTYGIQFFLVRDVQFHEQEFLVVCDHPCKVPCVVNRTAVSFLTNSEVTLTNHPMRP